MKNCLFSYVLLLTILCGSIAAAENTAKPNKPVAAEPGNPWAKYEIKIIRDVNYLPEPNRAEKADIYIPQTKDPDQRFPAVIYIHGGGWSAGNKADGHVAGIVTTLAKNGYVCMSINYLLSRPGRPTWPQNIHDCKNAVRFLRKNAEKYHCDPDRFAAMGGSAGAHLSAMLGLTDPNDNLEPPGFLENLAATLGLTDPNYNPDPNDNLEPPDCPEVSTRVKAVIPFFGPFDFNVPMSKRPKTQDYVDGLITKFLGKTKQQAPEIWKAASPVTYVTPDDPPFLLIHGSLDWLVNPSQSQLLHSALRSKNVASKLVIVPLAGHGFPLNHPNKDLRPIIFNFLEEHLGSEKITPSKPKKPVQR